MPVMSCSPAITPDGTTTSRTTTSSRRCCGHGITRKDRETIGGRTAIRLAERTAEWTAGHSRRYLPTWWEWLVIVLFTSPDAPVPAGTAASPGGYPRYHAARAAVVVTAVVLLALVAADQLGVIRARAAVRELENAEARNVPKVIENLASCRNWADPILRKTIDDDATEPRAKLARGWRSCRSTRRKAVSSSVRSSTASQICSW